MWDTITAISSGKVNQAISIIRIAGPEAIQIIKKIFTGKEGKNKEITFGLIKDNQQIIDEVLVAWFPGKNNYIGEDTVEINCHGGIVVSNMILELILSHGARMAEPGEFSRRAYLNGKIDLVKAEAINDLIHAKTTKQAQMSINKFDNKFSNLINNFLIDITYLIGHLEVNIDYPEITDVEELTSELVKPKIKELINDINKIIKVSENATKIYEGINVAIVGKPNVGKSSLLNALIKESKAIVTDIAGTTRDIVEGSFQIEGILFKLIDTAGIRKTTDKIEQIGIEKAKQIIESSEIVIHVVDSNSELDEEDLAIEAASKFKKYIRVYNKNDLSKITDKNKIKISALNNDLEELEIALVENYKDIDLNSDYLIYNTRQLAAIKSAKLNLEEALNGLEYGFGPEVIVVDITEAWKNIGSIVGKDSPDDLLTTIFSNFCLGK
ncbi:tRNA uridine-5-carboxymethylaminomethyl(34) synthesis GTPase MnmE [Mycoplasma zalophi]|uniref:tRNA uridine-5-carboxymethylaminomethyl(34) synthesis GTPase MnmE n=1 Tax=Mycoplasma zalophi TaxID=191287 RepID=UPI0021C86781|nr:tRNA uridine-5-carboxymethylaminomethyl(34) synthesis GTPase MnmE [Mycoplasma zalophi]MCU4117006.1 tRNA uridine-5-carboxymethylaminomethyl(34) synthesis GTPase MnmE [Mycoplasma zalophi]